VRITLPRFL